MHLLISIATQSARLFDDHGVCVRRYAVSTSVNGPGERKNSYQTPRGRHLVRAKIGKGLPSGAVLVGRRPTGEICTPSFVASAPDRDWILTRILWLSGIEPGINRLGDRDTMQRYIYIHGTPDSNRLGTPGSQGCIRMSNDDIVELFDLLPCFSRVDIGEL